MVARALHLLVISVLIGALSGGVQALAEAVADEHAACCADCDDADCPEQSSGEPCPPQCDDCVCPGFAAPLLVQRHAGAPARSPEPVTHAAASAPAPESPPLPGVFRPPRALA